ncbi:MAG: hypothetical protein JW768_13540 [Chitinispirillaceae bacterium]|nr:hypothetical protein [Chitinispirillaceae bacterium]
MIRYVSLFFIVFLSCSQEEPPVLNFTVSGKISVANALLDLDENGDTLDCSTQLRFAAFLRRYDDSLSTYVDSMVSNESVIKCNVDSNFSVGITTATMHLQPLDHIYLLGYYRSNSKSILHKASAGSSVYCPIFKGGAAVFIYANYDALLENDNAYEWYIENDSTLVRVTTSEFPGASLMLDLDGI